VKKRKRGLGRKRDGLHSKKLSGKKMGELTGISTSGVTRGEILLEGFTESPPWERRGLTGSRQNPEPLAEEGVGV